MHIGGIHLLFALSFVFLALPESAQARSCDNFPHDPGCHPAVPSGAPSSPTGGLQVTADQPKKTLSPMGLYRVEFVCRSIGTLPVATVGAFVQTSTAASLLLAVSEQNTGGAPTPDTSKAILSVYNIGGPATSRTSYINQACNNHPFFVAPRRPLTLIAAESNIETNTLGPVLQAIEGAIGVASSSWPLFTGQEIPSDPGKRLSAISNTAPPIASFVSAFNTGLTSLVPKDLTEGHTRIKARFATIDVYVTKLVSIVGVEDNGQFQIDLESMISKMVQPGVTGSSSNADLDSKCFGSANTLGRLNNFSKEDIAFSLLLVGQTSGLTAKSQYIHCLGREYAPVAVAEGFVTSLAKDLQFDKNDVATVFPDVQLFVQPDFQDVKPQLVALMGLMRGYALLPSPPDFVQTPLGKTGMNSEIDLDNEAEISSDKGVLSNGIVESAVLMKGLKDKGFTRFGCLMRDALGTAYFLAIPEKSAGGDKGYQAKEAILMEAWVNSAIKLTRLRISVEGDQIAAVLKNNANICGPGAIFADK
jgi:hypothetical protein